MTGVLRMERSLEAMFLASQIGGLLVSIALARSIGPVGRGTITILAMWGVILGWLAAFSLDKAIIVISKAEYGDVDTNEALASCRMFVLGLTLPMIGIAILVGRTVFHDQIYTVMLVVITAATAQGEVFAGWLLARNRRATFISWRLLQPTSYLVTTVIVVVTLRHAAVSTRTMFIGIGLTASVLGPVLAPLVLAKGRLRPTVGRLRDLLRFAVGAQAANILQYLNGRLDLLTLPFLVGPRLVGFYAVGAGAGQIPLLMGTAAAVRGLTGQTRKADIGGLLFVVVVCAGIVVSAPFVIPFVFGEVFRPSVAIAQILALGAALNYALQSSSGRLLGVNRPWDVAVTQGAGAIVFGIGIAAFPTLQGAAWSSVASFAISAVGSEVFWRYRRHDSRLDQDAARLESSGSAAG